MPSYSRSNNNRSSRPSGSSRGRNGQRPPSRSGQGQRRRPPQGQGSRPLNTQGNHPSQRPYKSNRNYRTISGHDTGLSLRGGHRGGPQGFISRLLAAGPVGIAIVAGSIVLLLLLVFGISSCVRGCSAPKKDGNKEVNQVDARVAAGVSEDLTKKLTPALDQAEQLEKIAANANKYDDKRLIDLALREPDAIPLVANYPKAKKEAQPYGEKVEQGSFPKLFTWDERWGYVTYAKGALAVTGSGPTVASMAYMGLTGKTDRTPAVIAQTMADKGYASGDSFTKSSYFSEGMTELSIAGTEYTVSADNITAALDKHLVIAFEVKGATITEDAHWILIFGKNEDGSINLFDPTSTSASDRPWAASTIASYGKSMYVLTVVEQEDTEDTKTTTQG